MNMHTSLHSDPAWYASDVADYLIRQYLRQREVHFHCAELASRPAFTNEAKTAQGCWDQLAEDALDQSNRIIELLERVRTEAVNFASLDLDDDGCEHVERDTPTVSQGIELACKMMTEAAL